MGKVYKGYELYRMIANGEIKKNSQFKDNNSQIWNWNGFDFISEYDDYNDYVFSIMDFELLEDKETGIEELDKRRLNGLDGFTLTAVEETYVDKINEIIRVVNKMQQEFRNKTVGG